VPALCFSHSACGAGEESIETSSMLASDEQVKSMKIKITAGKNKVVATLNNSEAACDFISMLPLTLTLEDYASTEKVSDLPKQLSTNGSPAGGEGFAGDITYYAPWGNLAIFYKNSTVGYANGLVILGKIDGSPEIFNTTDQ
jgi:hypothetical protein